MSLGTKDAKPSKNLFQMNRFNVPKFVVELKKQFGDWCEIGIRFIGDTRIGQWVA